MYNLCICAVFKNESHILYEWIQHYLHRGVDHIYLVNDYSNDNFQEIIDALGEKITLYNNDIITSSVGRQSMIYEKYFRPILETTKWVAILDLDEFLYSPYTTNLYSIINKYDQYSQIIVDWLNFGSSDHKYQPQSVTDGFRMHSIFDKSKNYYGFKSIFKSTDLINFNIHTHSVIGNSLHIDFSDTCDLIINHYPIQSLDFFMKIKSTRGDINNWIQTIGKSRNLEYYKKYDNNDIYDDRLAIQNENIISMVKDHKIENLEDITLVITSCNRPLLLDKTLESFIKYNTYPIKETYIIDDSGIVGCNDSVICKYGDTLKIKMIYNHKNIGQVNSIDKIYSYVTTKWIFHCEEDWEFLQDGFIEKSKKVFDDNPNEKIFTVWLRPHNNTNGHPIDYDILNRGYYEMSRHFSYTMNNKVFIWAGITFNPGLRRTVDCLKFHPYSKKCDKLWINEKSYLDEYMINDKYRTDGYYSFILDNPSGHVRHIGDGYHVMKDIDYA